MNRADIRSHAVFAVAAGLALSLLGWQATQAEPAAVAADISGNVQAKYPQGCVDCHDGTTEPTVGAKLEKFGHENVDEDTAMVPGDCADCHSEEGGMWFLSEVAHMAHYRDPASNKFVLDYNGDCRHCHVMDGESGAASVKSGEKNW